MKKRPFVSIVICTQNRAEALKKYALNSILKLDYPNYEVVIVDDASKDKTQEILKEFKDKTKNLTIVKNNKARGLCYVRNLGVKYSKGEIIAFTDDDCIADKYWLEELIKPYLKDKKVMVVGGKTYIGNSNKIFNPNKNIFGCNMSFRKEIFNNFSFDINIYFSKCSSREETELIYRIKNKNLKIIYADKAIVKHFLQPAKYRKNIKIGSPLNKIYMYAKKTSLIKYYFLFFITLFGKQNKFTILTEEEEIVNGFDTLIGIVSPKQKGFYKLPWILYILLLKIPIKAKIKNYLEERKLNS